MLPDRFTDAPVPSSEWRHIFRQRHDGAPLYASVLGDKIAINKSGSAEVVASASPDPHDNAERSVSREG